MDAYELRVGGLVERFHLGEKVPVGLAKLLEGFVVVCLENRWIPVPAVVEKAIFMIPHEAAEAILAGDLYHPPTVGPAVDEVAEEEYAVVTSR